MKQLLIATLIALVLGAGINGLLMGTSTYSVKAGVLGAGMAPQPAGMRRQDTILPDTKVVDAYRTVYAMHHVADSDPQVQTDFPVQSYQY